MSLRSRLLAGMAVVVIVLLATATVVTRTTRDHLTDQVDQQLERAVGPGSPWRAGPPGSNLRPGTGPPSEGRGFEQLNEYYFATVGGDGAVEVLATPRLSGADVDATPVFTVEQARDAADDGDAAFTVGSDPEGERFRLLVRDIGRNDAVLVVGQSIRDVDDAVGRLVLVELLATLAVIAVLSLVTWWVLRLGVRPIRAMTAAASSIAAGDLSHRVPEAESGTEAGDLGEALNSMLGRIETAFDERTESEARLRRFVADASHELRTPVTTIRGYSELYRHGGLQGDGELDEAMRRTEEEATRMGNLVADLLQLARLDQGRPLEQHPVALDALAEDAVRDALAVHPDRTITVAATPAVVTGDEERLRQVIANLMTNAVEHTPSTAAVHVTVAPVDGWVQLVVADDGPGMAPDDVAKAFERFHRADPSRSRRQGGSGLGLSIVAAIVEAHGGTVGLTSELGAGTVVAVRLPMAAAPPSPPPAQ